MLIRHLSIIGVGLIGGSLARALKKAKLVEHVTGCNRSEDTMKRALNFFKIELARFVLFKVSSPMFTSKLNELLFD